MTRNVSWRNLSRDDRTFSVSKEPSSYRRLRLLTRFAIVSSRYHEYSPFLFFFVAEVLSMLCVATRPKGPESVCAAMSCGLGWTLAPVCDAQSRCSVVLSHVATSHRPFLPLHITPRKSVTPRSNLWKWFFCILYCYETIIFQYAIVTDRAGVQPMGCRLGPRPWAQTCG